MSNPCFILSGPPLSDKWNYSSAGEYLFNKIQENGDSTAMISAETGEELSYKQLFERSLKLSSALEKLRLKVNDKICICSENSSNFVITFLSSVFLGHKKQSIGVLQPGNKAKVIPLKGNSKEALGPNCEGELCFKGDTVMKGYYGDEEATKAAIDEDGFLHSGDVGFYDKEGFLYVVDRVKELIKYKGFQVPPAELENILLGHPAVKNAAVVGLPDELAGELPFAFVVKQPESNVSAVEIIQHVNERISPQKRLRGGIRFIDAIPKNPSGKILRRELRDHLKLKEC